MAGMLPGVECARRRRFHQGGSWAESQGIAGNTRTRRPSFCLYTSSHETHLVSISSKQITKSNQNLLDEKLDGVAREAKERLDERLRSQRKPETKRHNSGESFKCEDNGRSLRSVIFGDLQTLLFGSKRSSSKKFSWAKMGWKYSKQDECTVCLEQFKSGEALVQLPCGHRFHSRCLVPWLENNAHCPCCRMGILS
ncbi:PREDICTED: probable E3 ubiquitin-protein ligase RHY1A [Nelumbo nucifera]|uniref:RING-type E3 ubiquitin transferase n=1 Tax=Nelumbo nucifera TaxID=4432 RepID=A0A1U8ARR8_NELNU|nr:PREDICTED: probable E3 ubiquitin-protein ligase RHY1A [Nelumbo nucifera]XP_010265713.1 PREDICTED: probable E3 ubiquitin-protein ligase RHY1A [Nelumbo nucifera]XP_010265714.1 PREDICTED: probable E3 ubiquitin-protein ligase RHY1A [Nelumbo nucifera]